MSAPLIEDATTGRIAFEAWCKTRCIPLERTRKGEYSYYSTDARWETWCAATDGIQASLNEAYAEGREDEREDWLTVARDGMPPCNGETVFVGINTAGFASCFNEVTHDGVCSMRGPELGTVQMSGLHWWRALARPATGLPT